MNTNTEEKKTYKNIDIACNNFKAISDNINNTKFEHIDTWINKISINFKKENNSHNINNYPRFDYGTIIKVDFGINTGSELSNPHFAIVLEKYDSTKSDTITILPLTSKNKKYNLSLSDLIIDEFTRRLVKYIKVLKLELEEIIRSKSIMEKAAEKQKELRIVQKMIDYYSNYAKNSYACINQITTIRKKKIIPPKNKFDIIGRAKCNSKTMEIISKEIIKKYAVY